MSIAGVALLGPQGPLGEAARRMTRHMGLWGTECANLGLVFGIVWNMTEKPGTATVIVACAVGYLAGIGLAYGFTRGWAPEAAPAPAPAS